MKEYITKEQYKRIFSLTPYQMIRYIKEELAIIIQNLEEKEKLSRAKGIETKFVRERIMRLKYISVRVRIPKKLCGNWKQNFTKIQEMEL